MDLSNPLGSLLPANEARALRVLARLESPISGRQVHALAGEGSYSGMRLALERLCVSGLVEGNPSSSSTNYAINRDHLLWQPIKDILESRSRLFRNIRNHLTNSPEDDAEQLTLSVSLYGSVARGDSGAASDVDLAVVYENEMQKAQEQMAVDTLVRQIERWTSSAVQLYDVTRAELAAMARSQDPIINSWVADSVTVMGPSISTLIAQGSR